MSTRRRRNRAEQSRRPDAERELDGQGRAAGRLEAACPRGAAAGDRGSRPVQESQQRDGSRQEAGSRGASKTAGRYTYREVRHTLDKM